MNLDIIPDVVVPAPAVAADSAPAKSPRDEGIITSIPPTTDAPAKDATDEAPKPELKPVERPEKSGLQRRIDQLTREKYEAQRQAEQERFTRLQEQSRLDAERRVQDITRQEPNPEQFESLYEFQRAHSDWSTRRAMEMFGAQAQIRDTEEQIRAAHQQRQMQEYSVQYARENDLIASKMQEGVKKYPDLAQVLENPDLPSARGTPLFQAVLTADNAADIAYTLGKNPDEYVRLLQLSVRDPVTATREVLELDRKFSGASKVTAAPPPAREIAGQSPGGQKAPSDMTYSEYVRWRRQSR